MSPKMMLLVAAAVFPATAMAQSDPAEKSPEQIRCELNNDCVAAADPTVGEDGAATRSWSWGARATPAARTTAPRVSAPRAAPQRPRSSALAASATQPARSTATQRVRAKRPAPDVKPSTNLAINFAPGTAMFTTDGRTQADKVFLAINTPDLAKRRYLIAGHTDAAGNAELNRELSRRRAQALVDFLVDKGMPRKSFRVRGYGYDRPLDGVSPTSPTNRRVEIVKLD